LRRTIKAPIDYSEKELILKSSIGLASWTPEHTLADQLMRDAELAKDQAKRDGGDRIEPFRPAFRQSKDDAVILLDDLGDAIKLGQLQLFYQPIISLDDRKTKGFEALVIGFCYSQSKDRKRLLCECEYF